MKKLKLVAPILLIISALPFKGYSTSLDETALSILTGSPSYHSQELTLQSQGRSLATESNLPDPTLGGEYLWMPQDVDNRWTLELRWGVEWPGVYGARNKEAKLNLNAIEKGIIEQRYESLAEIKGLLLDYIQCRQKLALLNELTLNNDTIYRLAEHSLNNGELTVLDLNKVKLEYANIRVAKAAIEDEEAQIIADLSLICGRDCTEYLTALDCRFPEIYLPSDAEMETISKLSPGVQMAEAEAEAARQKKKVAKMEALPSLELGYKHAFEDGMHFNGVVWGISLPMFSSRGKQKAADAAILEAEFNARKALNEAETEIGELQKRLALAKFQIEEISPIVESVDYNTTLLNAYEGGVLTIIEYISDRNYFTNAAVELVTLRHAAAKTQVALQKYLSLTELPKE